MILIRNLRFLRYPQARIVAVEASEENYRMLRLNTFNYPNVLPLHGGLWPVMGYPLPCRDWDWGEKWKENRYVVHVIYGVEIHRVIVIVHVIHVDYVTYFIQ